VSPLSKEEGEVRRKEKEDDKKKEKYKELEWMFKFCWTEIRLRCSPVIV
jgi:hypothetical protein